ncbi:MAG: hypothetical protein BWZ02_02666 [Lentisphaerae bacterium ADurb.BinA184]|nr:MAG: hypothetical protein BWZ02_02666 [Lentisphaerae bacterium ADurb.BinA184]
MHRHLPVGGATRDVNPLRGAALRGVEVKAGRLQEEVPRLPIQSQAQRPQGMNAGRQRRVMGGDRDVVIPRRPHLGIGELVREQHHQQQHVGLLEILAAVEPFLGDACGVAPLAVRPELLEARLGQLLEALALQDPFRVGGTARDRQRGGRLCELRNLLAAGAAPLAHPGRQLQVEGRQAVGVGIVVGDRRVFVRPHHPEDRGMPVARAPVHAVEPVAGGLHHDAGEGGGRAVNAPGGGQVVCQAIHHVGGHMDFMLGILEIAATLLPVGVGFPWVARPAIPRPPGQGLRRRQVANPELDKRLRLGGIRVEVERQEVGLGVPEEMSLVGLAGVPLGINGHARVVRHMRPQQVVDRGAQDQLRRGIAVNLDIAPPPGLRPVPGVFGMQLVPAPAHGRFQDPGRGDRLRVSVGGDHRAFLDGQRPVGGDVEGRLAPAMPGVLDISPVGRPGCRHAGFHADGSAPVGANLAPDARGGRARRQGNRREMVEPIGRHVRINAGPDGHRHRHIAFQMQPLG